MGRKLLVLFRWGIFLLACGFLYTRLTGPKGIVAMADRMPALDDLWALLGCVALLMLVNWGIEAYKWRLLLRPIERLSFGRVFAATIAGTSVGLVTLNRTGEFLGRILFLAPQNRTSGAFASALGSIAQFLITLLLGISGLIAIVVSGAQLPWAGQWITWALVTLTALVALIALVCYFYTGILRELLLLVPFLHRLDRASSVLGQYERGVLLQVLLLSLLRYAVFASQFALMLWGMEAGVGWSAMLIAIPVVYLIATLVPSIMLTELGVRGSVAMAVLGSLGGHDIAVVVATSILWTINVALPAIVGSVIMLVVRIRTPTDPRR